ncbi:hypothetical protein Vretimale_14293 [Volvox reticuliferus]|uniref:DUF4203 domain-containing protein n=1 Tax=Volvox reticuliferus TaxID=1737510 RepID=A0A8J4GN76_9CHLO|nr:hypothetical protein Vretifemale_15314 [Volvox reticuliferus]GIM10726.1 hypothetical protein Vretimale_14293 [Volvox reticuliferus]
MHNRLQLTVLAVVVFITFLCVADAQMGESFGSPEQKKNLGVSSGILLSRIFNVWRATMLKVTSNGLPAAAQDNVIIARAASPPLEAAVIDPALVQQPLRFGTAAGLASGSGSTHFLEYPLSVPESTVSESTVNGAAGTWKSVVSTAGQLLVKRIIKVLDELRPKLPMLGTVLAGWVLVLFAKEMSKSMALRVTGGGLVVGLMMGTIVLCWLRKTLRLRGGPIFGVAVGISAWMAGLWRLPSLTYLISNTYLVAGVGFFWFIGSVSVYVWGAGMDNPRMETLLAISFRLLGHLLLYIGLWEHETLAMYVQILGFLYCIMPTSWRERFWRALQLDFDEPIEDPHAPLKPNCGPHRLIVHGFIWNRLMVAIPIDGPEFRELLALGYEPNIYSGKMELVSEAAQYPPPSSRR